MSHHIYHTEAIILGARAHGEGDRLLYCYTRDLGLVVAHARSIRESRSRLRYALQTFSHAHIDLIRGKHGWKLISATPIASLRTIFTHTERRHIAAQHLELTRRLVQGEEPHESLFSDLLRGLTFLTTIHDTQTLRDAELLLVMRLLRALGYWGGSVELLPILEQATPEEVALSGVRQHRKEIITLVNDSLRSSQL